MAKTKDALKILRQRNAQDAEVQALMEEARVNADIAQLIYDTRIRAGLTQQQLADLVGTTQPVISRLEDADYEGHSLTMLQRIAAALQQRLELRFVPSGPVHDHSVSA